MRLNLFPHLDRKGGKDLSGLILEALRSGRNESTLPNTLHHRDEVGNQPNDSDNHPRN